MIVRRTKETKVKKAQGTKEIKIDFMNRTRGFKPSGWDGNDDNRIEYSAK